MSMASLCEAKTVNTPSVCTVQSLVLPLCFVYFSLASFFRCNIPIATLAIGLQVLPRPGNCYFSLDYVIQVFEIYS
jgi:hypothetical protein